jgi:hypothetical protein
LNLNVNPTVDG